MHDYNFFESYRMKKQNKGGSSNTFVTLAFLLFFVTLIGIFGYTYYKVDKIDQEILTLNNTIAKTENQELLKRLEDKKALLGQVQVMATDLQAAAQTLDTGNPINQKLLDDIVASLPADAQLVDISYNQDSVALNGKAALRSAIAEYERSLRQVVTANSISVSNITFAEGVYSFGMTISFGGEADESIQ